MRLLKTHLVGQNNIFDKNWHLSAILLELPLAVAQRANLKEQISTDLTFVVKFLTSFRTKKVKLI